MAKIYTRRATTAPPRSGTAAAWPKSDPRTEAYGTLDEAGSALGVARSLCGPTTPSSPPTSCAPERPVHRRRRARDRARGRGAARGRRQPGDRRDGGRARGGDRPLHGPGRAAPKFVIPGGTQLSAAARPRARAILRRAERRVARSTAARLASRRAPAFLNRASDAVYAMARFADVDEPELFEGAARAAEGLARQRRRPPPRAATPTTSRSRAATRSSSTSRPSRRRRPGPSPPGCSPPRSPPAPRSPSRCTPTARAGTSGAVEVEVDVDEGDGSAFEEIDRHPPRPRPTRRGTDGAPADDRRASARCTGPSPARRGRDRDRIECRSERPVDLGLGGRRACVVTGASRGIGLATARMLCAEGASVLLVARGAERLAEAAASAARGGAGGGAERWPSTSPSPTPASASSPRPSERFGTLDVLVNNAGAARWRDLEDVPDGDWYAAWELNVMAPMRLMRAAIPAMAERGWGRVVNVASSAGKRPSAMMPEYSVAKAASSPSRASSPTATPATGCSSTRSARARRSRRCGWTQGGLLDQSKEHGGAPTREDALARPRRQAPDRPARPRARRSRRRSSSSAPSAPPTSPAPPGASTAAPCR